MLAGSSAAPIVVYTCSCNSDRRVGFETEPASHLILLSLCLSPQSPFSPLYCSTVCTMAFKLSQPEHSGAALPETELYPGALLLTQYRGIQWPCKAEQVGKVEMVVSFFNGGVLAAASAASFGSLNRLTALAAAAPATPDNLLGAVHASRGHILAREHHDAVMQLLAYQKLVAGVNTRYQCVADACRAEAARFHVQSERLGLSNAREQQQLGQSSGSHDCVDPDCCIAKWTSTTTELHQLFMSATTSMTCMTIGAESSPTVLATSRGGSAQLYSIALGSMLQNFVHCNLQSKQPCEVWDAAFVTTAGGKHMVLTAGTDRLVKVRMRLEYVLFLFITCWCRMFTLHSRWHASSID
jgi:hypothetical protein